MSFSLPFRSSSWPLLRALCLSLAVHLVLLVVAQAVLGRLGGALTGQGVSALLYATLRSGDLPQGAGAPAPQALLSPPAARLATPKPTVPAPLAASRKHPSQAGRTSARKIGQTPARLARAPVAPGEDGAPGQSPGAKGELAQATGASGAGRAAAEEGEAARASLLRLFRLALLTEARNLKRYPPVSRAQAEEGVSHIQVAWCAAEQRFAIAVARSSGFARLDEAAQALLEAATRRALLPAALSGADFSLTVPIVFRLDES